MCLGARRNESWPVSMPCSSSRGARRRNPAPRPGAGRVRLSKPPRGPDGSGSPPARLRASGLLQLPLRRRLSAALSGADGFAGLYRTASANRPRDSSLGGSPRTHPAPARRVRVLAPRSVAGRSLTARPAAVQHALRARPGRGPGEPGPRPTSVPAARDKVKPAATFFERFERLRSFHPSWPTGWRVRCDCDIFTSLRPFPIGDVRGFRRVHRALTAFAAEQYGNGTLYTPDRFSQVVTAATELVRRYR